MDRGQQPQQQSRPDHQRPLDQVSNSPHKLTTLNLLTNILAHISPVQSPILYLLQLVFPSNTRQYEFQLVAGSSSQRRPKSLLRRTRNLSSEQ